MLSAVSGPEFEERFYSAEDGLRLHARVYGGQHRDRLPVVCLPGLSRNCRDFHDLALALSGGDESPRKVIAFDYRGRGRSAHDRNWRNYNIEVETRDVGSGLTALGIEHAAFIGTSRGALVIMALAGLRPTAIRAAVLNDTGPVIEGSGLARIRSQLERMPRPADFAEAVALQRRFHGASFPALGEADWERQARAIYRVEDGRPVADFDPALLRTLKAIDFSSPLPVMWPQFQGLARVPVMLLRGEHSDILSARTLEEMAARHPDLQSLTVEGQGHAPLLETGELPRRIGAFIVRAEGRRDF